jgi:hypothetical protein
MQTHQAKVLGYALLVDLGINRLRSSLSPSSINRILSRKVEVEDASASSVFLLPTVDGVASVGTAVAVGRAVVGLSVPLVCRAVQRPRSAATTVNRAATSASQCPAQSRPMRNFRDGRSLISSVLIVRSKNVFGIVMRWHSTPSSGSCQVRACLPFVPTSLLLRPDRCPLGTDCFAAASTEPFGTSEKARPPTDRQRDLLRAAHRLRMAVPAQRLPTLADGVLVFLPLTGLMAPWTGFVTPPAVTRWPGAGIVDSQLVKGSDTVGKSIRGYDAGNHAGAGIRQARQRPQTAYRHRHFGAVADHDSGCGQRARPRRRQGRLGAAAVCDASVAHI